MPLPEKILQRLTDPVFYRKHWRDSLRRFKRFDDHPKATTAGELGDFDRLVLVVAHPDDETFCSGLLCELTGLGKRVTVLCLTRGEGGPTGGGSREDLGRVRAAEMELACETMGVEDLVFLEHLDPVAGAYRVYAPDVSAAELAEQIRPLVRDSEILLSHGSNGEYWHPAHLLVHEAVANLTGSLPLEEGPAWLTFLARNGDHPLPRLVNWDDPVFLRQDFSQWEEKRVRALECHVSQLGLFGRFAGGSHEDFVRNTAVESYRLVRRGSLQIPKPADEGKA